MIVSAYGGTTGTVAVGPAGAAGAGVPSTRGVSQVSQLAPAGMGMEDERPYHLCEGTTKADKPCGANKVEGERFCAGHLRHEAKLAEQGD